jgi:AAA family ATPase
VNKYVGETEHAVREISRKARSASPSIFFSTFPFASLFATYKLTHWRAQDEIDALVSSRSPVAVDTGTDEGVLLSLLNEMDGVEEWVGVTVIGATNWPGSLLRCPVHFILCHTVPSPLILPQDPGLIRPGKLDRTQYVRPPDFAGRVEILGIRTCNMAVEPALDLDAIAALIRPRLSLLRNLRHQRHFIIDRWHRRAGAPGQKSQPYA